jgi:hypothetical protein
MTNQLCLLIEQRQLIDSFELFNVLEFFSISVTATDPGELYEQQPL